jgi:hypothetical protein
MKIFNARNNINTQKVESGLMEGGDYHKAHTENEFYENDSNVLTSR